MLLLRRRRRLSLRRRAAAHRDRHRRYQLAARVVLRRRRRCGRSGSSGRCSRCHVIRAGNDAAVSKLFQVHVLLRQATAPQRSGCARGVHLQRLVGGLGGCGGLAARRCHAARRAPHRSKRNHACGNSEASAHQHQRIKHAAYKHAPRAPQRMPGSCCLAKRASRAFQPRAGASRASSTAASSASASAASGAAARGARRGATSRPGAMSSSAARSPSRCIFSC